MLSTMSCVCAWMERHARYETAWMVPALGTGSGSVLVLHGLRGIYEYLKDINE
jgi:hypothetical protein